MLVHVRFSQKSPKMAGSLGPRSSASPGQNQIKLQQLKASVDLFQQQAALSFSSVGSDPSISKDLGDRAMFLAHVTPFYPRQLAEFPAQLTDLLRTLCLAMPSWLRNLVAQALILLMNRKTLVIEDLLALFQSIGDRNLRKLAFSNIAQTIRNMSVTDTRDKGIQKIDISMLEYVLDRPMQVDARS
ncbi:hypothetical protein HA466_0014790 [Hirschfeldia incana]|nr:hypothetical protein HA466_0014790 [Hirschfeldia incana]